MLFFVLLFSFLHRYVLSVAGYSCLTFTLGGISFWAGAYFTDSLNLELDKVTLLFGIISLVAGLLGAISGGVILDKLGGTHRHNGVMRALLLCVFFLLPGSILGVICALTHNAGIAFSMAGISVFCMCSTLAPINGVILKVVPLDLRAFAISLNLFMIHFLGDFPRLKVSFFLVFFG
jgi:hypothetical protein